MSKYIGTDSGLIGPVPEKPTPPPAKEVYGDNENQYRSDWYNYNCNTELYFQTIRNLESSPIKCEGWFPEIGKEYDEKDFRWQQQYCYGGFERWHDCTPQEYEILKNKDCDLRIVAVPLPAANEPIGFMPFLKELKNYFGEHDKTPFEHKAFAMVEKIIQSIQAVETVPAANDVGDGFSELHPEKLTKPMSDKKEDWLAYFLQNVHKAKDLTHLFNSIWDASVCTTYPAKFVEWVDCSDWLFWKDKGWRKLVVGEKYITTAELYTEWNKTKQ